MASSSASHWRPARVVVTGGAGFIGSHLCERLLDEGASVVCVDRFLTSSPENVAHLLDRAGFRLVESDVADGLAIDGPLDAVLHLASPASPVDYGRHPLETLKVGSIGTLRALELAAERRARFLLTSTSEVYGDPLVHPQPETYSGNVDPTAPRSVYDESKRFAEALASAYARAGTEVRIARLFNTIGPGMRPGDGRLLPTLLTQALRSEPMTIHGTGEQTRSLAYVSDIVEGLWRLLRSEVRTPVNIGNPDEHTVLEIAREIARGVGAPERFRFVERPAGDPERRRPDISLAERELGWRPEVSLSEALRRTVPWFAERVLVDVGAPM
ncbi:MAG: NAD-dependent epimerase/dehydratase family protein [Actinomycetota bacterium]